MGTTVELEGTEVSGFSTEASESVLVVCVCVSMHAHLFHPTFPSVLGARYCLEWSRSCTGHFKLSSEVKGPATLSCPEETERMFPAWSTLDGLVGDFCAGVMALLLPEHGYPEASIGSFVLRNSTLISFSTPITQLHCVSPSPHYPHSSGREGSTLVFFQKKIGFLTI